VAEKRTEANESTADREIAVTRVFDASISASAEASDERVREYRSIESGEQTLARLAARPNGGVQ
jgi:hypothetical protein